MKILQALKVFILQLLIKCGILSHRRKQVPLTMGDFAKLERQMYAQMHRKVSPNRKRRRGKISETKRKHRQKLNAAKKRRLTRGEEHAKPNSFT